jgi:hypothetical protein
MKKPLTALIAAASAAAAAFMTPTKADAGWGWWVPAPGRFVVSVENGLGSYYLQGYTYGPNYGMPPLCYANCPAYYGHYAPRVYYRPYYQQRHYYFYG